MHTRDWIFSLTHKSQNPSGNGNNDFFGDWLTTWPADRWGLCSNVSHHIPRNFKRIGFRFGSCYKKNPIGLSFSQDNRPNANLFYEHFCVHEAKLYLWLKLNSVFKGIQIQMALIMLWWARTVIPNLEAGAHLVPPEMQMESQAIADISYRYLLIH